MMTRNENLKTYSIKEIPHYHIYGRTDETQNLLPLFWNGSGIEVNVTGSELWIDLDVDCSFHEPWIATELNGAFMSRQMLLPGSYSICLFRSMTFGVPKTMKFFRELQAMSEDDDCHVFVRGFRCDGEFLPVKEHKYKIELFFNLTWSTLLNEKNTLEYSFVLSVVPDNESAEFIIVAQSVLCKETLLLGLSDVP